MQMETCLWRQSVYLYSLLVRATKTTDMQASPVRVESHMFKITRYVCLLGSAICKHPGPKKLKEMMLRAIGPVGITRVTTRVVCT
jgi:hypothetical protein